jgi:serine/threonine protein kinase
LRITDFGLARSPEDDASVTATGALLGTPAYMPPEQAAGQRERLGPPSDVYSLGAILYELLTGRPPFHANSQLETVRLVLEQEPVPPGALNREVSRELEAICLHALEKDPARRYQSAGELAADLQRFLHGEPIQARSHRASRWIVRYRWPLGVAAAAALFAIAMGLGLRRHPQPSPAPVATARPAPVSLAPSSVADHKISKKPPLRAVVPIKRGAPGRSQETTAPVPGIELSVSPDHGTGYSQVFIFHYRVPDDSPPIREVDVDFHDPSAIPDQHCLIFIELETGLLQLQFNPAGGPGLRVSGTQGTLARLENPVCVVDLTGVPEMHHGNDLEIRLPMRFKPSFEGSKIIESRVWAKGAKTPVAVQGRGQWFVGAEERNP